MKKVLTLIWILVFPVIAVGQLPVDNILKARALAEAGKTDQAVLLLSNAISQSRDSRLYCERAEAYIIKGNYSEAISDYNEANKISASSGEYGLSRIYALKGDAATSVYHLELNLNSAFRRGEKEIMLDAAFGAIENKPEWRQFWKKEWYSPAEESISEIEYYTSVGKNDESKVVLTQLKNSSSLNGDVLYAEAIIAVSYGKYSDAVRLISQAVSLNPGSEKYLRILARAQIGVGNPSGASVTFSQLIDSGTADAELFLLRAECYRKTTETDKALTDIERYLAIYPESRNALSLAGKVVAASGDNLKALQYFSDNLKLHPNDPECYTDRANSYFVSKSWDLAVKDYSMSLDLKPGNSETWLNKGISLLNSGKTDDACHDFRKSLSLGNKRAAEYISRNCIK